MRFDDYFGTTHSCSGFCHEPLFGFSSPVASGRPQTNCRAAIRTEMKETFEFVSAVTVITTVAAIITFAAQYLLWKNYKQESGKHESTLEDTEGSIGGEGE